MLKYEKFRQEPVVWQQWSWARGGFRWVQTPRYRQRFDPHPAKLGPPPIHEGCVARQAQRAEGGYRAYPQAYPPTAISSTPLPASVAPVPHSIHEECCDRSTQMLEDDAPAWSSGHLRAAIFSVLQHVAATQARSLDLSGYSFRRALLALGVLSRTCRNLGCCGGCVVKPW